jgi:hypothetical protein
LSFLLSAFWISLLLFLFFFIALCFRYLNVDVCRAFTAILEWILFFFAILSLTLCERNQDEQYRKLWIEFYEFWKPEKNLGHFIFSLQEGTDKPIIDFKENPLALLE